MPSALKTHREAANLSQRQLADKLGMEAGAISRWERGVARPEDATKLRVAAVLGVSPEVLFPYDELEAV